MDIPVFNSYNDIAAFAQQHRETHQLKDIPFYHIVQQYLGKTHPEYLIQETDDNDEMFADEGSWCIPIQKYLEIQAAAINQFATDNNFIILTVIDSDWNGTLLYYLKPLSEALIRKRKQEAERRQAKKLKLQRAKEEKERELLRELTAKYGSVEAVEIEL